MLLGNNSPLISLLFFLSSPRATLNYAAPNLDRSREPSTWSNTHAVDAYLCSSSVAGCAVSRSCLARPCARARVRGVRGALTRGRRGIIIAICSPCGYFAGRIADCIHQSGHCLRCAQIRRGYKSYI